MSHLSMSRCTAKAKLLLKYTWQALVKKKIPVTCQSPGKPVALKSHLTKCPRLRIPTAMNTALGDFTQNACLIEKSNVRKQSQPQ